MPFINNLIIYIWLNRKFILNNVYSIHWRWIEFVRPRLASRQLQINNKSIKILNKIMEFSIENCLSRVVELNSK